MPFKIVRNDITRCERYDAITGGVYGCMMHTAFCNKSHSQEVFDNMKKDFCCRPWQQNTIHEQPD